MIYAIYSKRGPRCDGFTKNLKGAKEYAQVLSKDLKIPHEVREVKIIKGKKIK